MALHRKIEQMTAIELDTAPVMRSATLVTLFPVEPELSERERTVIALARRDPLGSLEEPGRIERWVGWVLGLRAAGHALADPRLETLRRAAVVIRHRHHLPDATAAELRSQGFGTLRIREIERLALGD